VDQAIEKAPKEPAPSPKKTPVKKTKAGKKGKSTVAPLKTKSVDASLSTKKPSKKSIASRPPKGKKKASVSSSSPDEEQPSAALTPPPSKKKKFTAPLFPFGAASRTRSKCGPKVNFFFFCIPFICCRQHVDLVNLVVVWLLLRLPWHTSSSLFFCTFFGIGFIISDSYYLFLFQDSDMVVDDIFTSSLDGDDLQTAVVDQDENLGKSVADSSEAGAESTEGGHSSSSDSLFDTTLGSVPEEQIIPVGSTADDANIPGADDSNIGSAGLMSPDLAIVPHASQSFGHGRDDGDAVDPEAIPLSFSVPQTVLTSGVTGMLHSILIPLSYVDKECTHTYFIRYVLICCRF
jgi:hypothetical protein